MIKKFTIQEYRKYLAAYKIKKWWLKKCYDPKYPMIHRIMEKRISEYYEH